MSIGLLFAFLALPAYGAPAGTGATAAQLFGSIFGYQQVPQRDITVFPQWLDVLEDQITSDLREGTCADVTSFNRCHLTEWHGFLDTIRDLPRNEQLERVNRFANEQNYVLDIENYGREDYWAIPELFLENGGDCEDYVIVKLFSLRWLGWDVADMRLVVVQDTNLRLPHAILAVASAGDIYILDNQASVIVPERTIVHYAPVYSISDRQWWLHLPKG
ncbi:MAG: transglutaminase-like cysteine peptidase [Gammaproteobacteria bacterium]|nr:transglutaminase-like cysteine peptidase [Gammaproteobacteria bacterium]